MPCQYATRRTPSAGVSRRGFLGGIGAGAAGAAGSVMLPAGAHAQPGLPGGLFADASRSLQPDLQRLPPFAEATPSVQQALRELGEPGGLMDAKDPLHVGPIRLITEPRSEPQQPRQRDPHRRRHVPRPVPRPRHDLRHDLAARRARPGPKRSPNTRTPAFDLDSVYGGGPIASPQLYDPSRPGQVPGGAAAACSRTCRAPRTARRSSRDPRNDENLIISGLQAAFILFHNRVVDRAVRGHQGTMPADSADVFDQAAGWSPGTTSGSSSTSSCRDRRARR